MNFIVNEVRKGMPIRAEPYKHQIDVFTFVCSDFGLALRLE